MLKKIRSANALASILIEADINKINGDSLKLILPKFRKTKMTKSKNWAKSKNLADLSKS